MFYLKYRPQTIAELDNKRIRESLGKALLDDNWTHAYLLVGPKGTGKTTTARLIAKIVNCAGRKKGEEPCNKCDSCKAITAGSALDVVEIDAASNTGVDDIRDLREKAKLSPSGSKYKVYIIDEVHMLSTSAFNALLKILEEPPKHVIFVLATTDPQKLPATVVSRCMVYNFNETTREDVVAKLQKISTEEKIKVSDEVLIKIVETVGLSHRDAQKLLEQASMESASGKAINLSGLTTQATCDQAEKVLQFLEAKNAKEAINLVNEILIDNIKIKDLILEMITVLRTVLLFRNGVGNYTGAIKISDVDVTILIDKLTHANSLLRDCPVPQLPLEMVILEYCTSRHSGEGSERSVEDDSRISWAKEMLDPANMTKDQSGMTVNPARMTESAGIENKWPEILVAIKPYNHSLVAFLRASRPVALDDDSLTLEVFYKFHKEKLEEKKNREILEKVVSDIMKKEIKVKFTLSQKEKPA